MNQEKLAKLQAQVRIGGKVRHLFCVHFLMNSFWLSELILHMFCYNAGHCTQKEEGCTQNCYRR